MSCKVVFEDVVVRRLVRLEDVEQTTLVRRVLQRAAEGAVQDLPAEAREALALWHLCPRAEVDLLELRVAGLHGR